MSHDLNLVAAYSKSSPTAENLQTLIEIQGEIIRCRRLAEEIDDPETARRLYAIADEIETAKWTGERNRLPCPMAMQPVPQAAGPTP